MDPALAREAENEAAASFRRTTLKMVVFLAVVLAAAVLGHRVSRESLGDAARWRDGLRAVGGWAPLAYAAANAVLVALGAPRLALAAIAGALFGFWRGALIAWVSAAVGAYSTFLFARWGARDWVRRHVRMPEGARALLRQPDVWSIVLLRQMPIVAFVQNAALGLTETRHRTFWAGTLIGTLPSTLVVALVGGSITRETWREAMVYLAAAMALLALMGMSAGRLRRRRGGKPGGGQTPPEEEECR